MLNKYRKYKINSKKLSKLEFKEKMKKEYVKIKTISTSGDPVTILLAKENSEWTRKTDSFRNVLDKLGDKEQKIIMISYKSKLHLLFKKIAPEYPHLELVNYSIDHFRNELPLGPHCSKHTILSDEEVRNLFTETLELKSALDIPKIFIDDPQIIWIGAKVYDIIKIETKSKITGIYINYRIVVPNPTKLKAATKSEGEDLEEEINPDFEPDAEIDESADEQEEPEPEQESGDDEETQKK